MTSIRLKIEESWYASMDCKVQKSGPWVCFYGGHSTGYKLGNHPKNIEPCAHRARTVRAPCDNAPQGGGKVHCAQADAILGVCCYTLPRRMPFFVLSIWNICLIRILTLGGTIRYGALTVQGLGLLTIQGPPGNNSFHSEPIRGNGDASEPTTTTIYNSGRPSPGEVV